MLAFERTGLFSKGQAHVRNDRLLFETMWLWAGIRKDGVVLERMGWCLKGRARIRKDRVVFERVGWCSKGRGCVRNGRLAFERTGLFSKQRAHVQNDGLLFETMWLWAGIRKDGVVLERM